MPSKKAKQAAYLPKRKLRTSAEVINRLKWSTGDDDVRASNTFMGYDCRIHGPLEKCVEDYSTIDEGGDIPEHRITYFRKVTSGDKDSALEQSVVWDRLGRLDRLFGSGEGPSSAPSPQTLLNIRLAMKTMERLAEEREMRLPDKIRQRARKAATRVAAAKATQLLDNNEESATTLANFQQRHLWKSMPNRSIFRNQDTKPTTSGPTNQEDNANTRRIVSWNVLFDLQRNKDNQLVQGDNSLLCDADSTLGRWQDLMDELGRTNADIVALQEVTPKFLQILQAQSWVQNAYTLSIHHEQLQEISLYGNVILWRTNDFKIVDVYTCQEGNRYRGLITVLSRGK